jgi:hypothetical protein
MWRKHVHIFATLNGYDFERFFTFCGKKKFFSTHFFLNKYSVYCNRLIMSLALNKILENESGFTKGN